MRDTAALSRIRRHAMKDIGLQRRKPKKKRFVEVTLDVPVDFGNPVPAVGGGSLHTFFKLPVQLDSVGKALFANIFQGHGDGDQTAHREDWLTVGFADAATFNQVLANSELHLEALRRPHRLPRETPTSIHYHQLAVRAVREQLAKDPANVSDATIGTISGMVIYAEISAVFEYWLPQRNGMLGVLESRESGVASIENEPHLRATVSWTELRGAYMQDIPALIPLPKSWIDIEHNARSAFTDPPMPSDMTDFFERTIIGSTLLDLIQRLSTLCQYAVSNPNISIPVSDVLICENVITHQLLSVRPEEDTQVALHMSAVLESCRLSLLLFIASIYRNFGAVPINTNFLVAKQHRLLRDQPVCWRELSTLRLWVMFVSALEATDAESKEFFTAAISAAAEELGIVKEEQILAQVRKFMWVPEIFDGRAEVLLEKIGEVQAP